MTPNTFVQCRVCQHVINVPQNAATRVVKCTNCNEATVSEPLSILLFLLIIIFIILITIIIIIVIIGRQPFHVKHFCMYVRLGALLGGVARGQSPLMFYILLVIIIVLILLLLLIYLSLD